MNSELKILMIEDSRGDAELVCYEIKKSNIPFIKKIITDRVEFLSSLEEFKPDMVVSDYTLPQFTGMEALELRNELKPDLPFILVTGTLNEEIAVECMKAGADDYILKNNLSRIGPAVRNAVKKIRLLEEKRIAEEALIESTERYRRLVDQSPDAIAVHCEGKFTFVNPAAVKLLGASGPQDLIGRSILEVVHPASHKKVVERIGSVMNGSEVPLFEEKFVKFDGTVIDVEVVGIPYMYQDKTASQVIVREITGRKRSEEALKQSELRFMQIAENSGEWIWEVDKNGLYTYSSPVIRDILGYEPEEIVGKKHFYDFFTDDIKERYKEEALRFFETKQRLRNFINPNLHKSGKVVILSTSGLPMLDSEGNLLGYRGSDTDITERILYEKKIKLSEEKYRTIFENIQDLYFEISMDGIILDVSPSVTAVSHGQYSREDLLGRNFKDFFYYPRDMETMMKQLMEKGYISDFEVTVKNRDGSKIHASVSTRIVLDENGMQRKMIGSIRDISARKKAEEVVEQESRLLRTVIDNIPDTIYIKDRLGRKLKANIADVRYTGFESEEMVTGKTDLEIIPGTEGIRGYKDDMKVINSGMSIVEKEEDFIDEKGNKRWLLTTKVPLFDKEGNVTGLVGIGHDITRRKITEEELITAIVKAEESDRLKTAFLHNISHEIRTPMNAIVGFSALLSDADTDEESRKSFIETIIQSSNHLLAIINDIVDISSIEANLVKIDNKETDIGRLVSSVISQFTPDAEKKKIPIKYDSVYIQNIMSDPTKLRQILTNLVGNAIKFTDSGYVSISVSHKEKFIEFSVSDTGIGIPAEHHSRIFDRFYQVQNNMSKPYEGTGLGLSISKSYVDLLGGEMWFRSVEGNGSNFYFTIPFRPVSSVMRTQVHDEHLLFDENKTILVAEDNDSNYRLIHFYLLETNAKVVRAMNGKEAVEYLQAGNRADLVLMDIKMPVMDGLTAVKKIRELNLKIPVIAQTAFSDEYINTSEAGFDSFLSKPFDKRKLFRTIREVL